MANKELRNKGKALAVFIDIEKAYDMLWREGLLFKLSKIGIDGQMFNWIKHFLYDSTFQVKIGDFVSDIFTLQFGTPQGSVISPFLFLIMINDFHLKIKNMHYALYADDIVIWKMGRNIAHLQKYMQTCLDRVDTWFIKWGFTPSSSKTIAVPFSISSKNLPVKLTLNKDQIAVQHQFKFLGMIFDTRFTWKDHVAYIKAKCLKRLNLLRRVSGTSWGASKKYLIIL